MTMYDDEWMAELAAADREIDRLGTELARAKTLLRQSRHYIVAVMNGQQVMCSGVTETELLRSIDKLLAE